jgi:carboxyl-terminal processing protease
VPPSSHSFKRVFLPALLLFALAGFAARLTVDREFRAWFDPHFWQAWWRVGFVMTLAHQDYLHAENVTYDKLGDHAVAHILDGLDPYTAYLPPDKYLELKNESDQEKVGAGVEIESWQGRTQIAHVFPNSPAYKADWQVGDCFVRIDNTDVRNLPISNISDLLHGLPGTNVTVTLDRPSDGSTLVKTLTRHAFEIPSVRDVALRPDGVGYLRLTQFGRNSGRELARELRRLQDQGMTGLVLDLRDNPGGLLAITTDVLKPLLKPDQLVTFTKSREGDSEEYRIDASGGGPQFAGPMAVLVNENSASAAEIVAGALQDANRAVLVGQRTFGKGIVQTELPVPGTNAGVRLTTQEWFLPGGRPNIQAKGIEPDVVVPLSPDLAELLRLQRADLRRLSPAEFAQFYGFAPVPDPQLETAASLVLAAGDHTFASLPKVKAEP